METPRYKLKTAPTIEPVTIAQLKSNLHIGSQDEENTSQDTYLQEILDAVVSSVQIDIGRQICRATYTLYLDLFPDADLNITMGPVNAITTIKYYDTNGVLQTMSSEDFQIDNIDLTARLRFLKTYNLYADKMNAIEIEFTNGWETAAAVPKDIKDAIILLASDRYLNPENAVLNFGMSLKQYKAEQLLKNYRVQNY